MAQTDATSRQFLGVAPTLFVADVIRAVAYYDEKLGFKSATLWGKPPAFAIPSRENLRVMLTQQEAGRIHPNGVHTDAMDAYFWVADADALHAEFAAAGADMVSVPCDEPAYGMREFAVRDPDGHVLIFGHDISEKGAAT